MKKERLYKTGSRLRSRLRCLAFILSLTFALACFSYAAENDKKPALQFSKNHDIFQIKPLKPVKSKLHRSAKGDRGISPATMQMI